MLIKIMLLWLAVDVPRNALLLRKLDIQHRIDMPDAWETKLVAKKIALWVINTALAIFLVVGILWYVPNPSQSEVSQLLRLAIFASAAVFTISPVLQLFVEISTSGWYEFYSRLTLMCSCTFLLAEALYLFLV